MAIESIAGVSYQEQNGNKPTLQLFDAVDGTWTKPLNQGAALEHYLSKVVIKCSVCRFTSSDITIVAYKGLSGGRPDAQLPTPAVGTIANAERAVLAHIENAQAKAVSHKGAEVLPRQLGAQTVFACSECDMATDRRSKVERHIDAILQSGPAHVGATTERIRRFSLEPVEVTPIQVVTPQASVVERSQPLRDASKRRRRRRRR